MTGSTWVLGVSPSPRCFLGSGGFGLGLPEVPRQQHIEGIAEVAFCHAIDYGGDVGLRV